MKEQEVGSWLRTITSNQEKLFFILGPCAIESEEHTMKLASFLKDLSCKLAFNLIFKAAFDKANRTSLSNYRGIGFEKGLEVLVKVKKTFKVPIITDIHESWQAERVAQVVDVIQIPAFLSRQTDLLLAAGKTGKVVHIKKAQFMRPEKIGGAVEKVMSTGNEQVWLCERGFTFGYTDLIVDMRSFPIMKRFGKPVTFDATHAVQRPGELGHATGGDRTGVASLAASAVVQGIAGLFMEVHDNPECALSDGPNSVRLAHLEDLLRYLIDLDEWVKRRLLPVIY